MLPGYEAYQELGTRDRMRGDMIRCPRGGRRSAGSNIHATEGSAAGGRIDIMAV